MNLVYLLTGSNLGNRVENLNKANIKHGKNPSKIASNVLGNYGRIFAEYVYLKKFRNNDLKKYVSIDGLKHLENLKNASSTRLLRPGQIPSH